MLFNSFQYFFFLAVVVPVYFATPCRYRWVPLLVASYYFYMCWNPAYILLIVASTLVDYVAARRMAGSQSVATRRLCLAASLTVNLGLLFTFKYYNFFVDNVAAVLDGWHVAYQMPTSHLLLPVGISFYKFQTLGYTIDVYRRKVPAERHLGKFALYVAFFPQLVAGPIERAARLLPQMYEKHRLDVDRIVSGARLILWGLFKKVVVADRLADFVNRIYDDPTPYSGATLLLATYFFAFQIYCDFSGYTNIAIGSARLLGFDLMQNFKLPYLATSIPDFWRRWHISLTTWFRDYVYFPLGGSRVDSRWIWTRNVCIVFLVSGLWHGANWTFAVWGLLHSGFYLASMVTTPARMHVAETLKIPVPLQRLTKRLITFHLVVLAWVFFRAESVGDAVFIVRTILTDLTGPLYLGPSQLATVLGVGLILVLIAVQWLQSHDRLPFYRGSRARWFVRWPAYVGLLMAIALLGKTNNEFIYFQF